MDERWGTGSPVLAPDGSGGRWAAAQARLLRMVATGRPLPAVLEGLCLAIEVEVPEALASVLLLDPASNTLHPGAAPSLPPAFVAGTVGLPVGPSVGSCGTAAHRREPVIVSDIASDPLWETGRQAALAVGLRACWSVPILGGHEGRAGQVLGTFAVYYRTVRVPARGELAHVREAANLASVAIERVRQDEELRGREQALRESQTQLAFALDAARMGLWHWTLAEGISRWSDGMGPLMGLPRGALAPPIEATVERMHPDDRERMRQEIEITLAERTEFEGEFRVIWPDGSVHWLLDRGRVVRDADGRAVRLDGAVLDVTDRKAAEAALAEQATQLEHARRLEALGRLAGGVAHDFNNLLTIVRNSADFALETLPRTHPAAGDLREVVEAADRAAALTQQLLAVGRRQLLRVELVDLREMLEDVAAMLRRLLGGHVTLRLRLDPTQPAVVRADRTHLAQVLLNLAANARDAMSAAGGAVTFTLGRVVLDAETAAGLAGTERGALRAGCYVTLAVSDTGTGMDEATRARIFEPFFTTKPFGDGTGLGLATVHGIVRQMEGAITVESAPGAGTTFTIHLPAIAVEAAHAMAGTHPAPTTETSEPSAIAPTARAQVLLVEDEAPVRAVVRRMLERARYAVSEAANGEEAMAWLGHWLARAPGSTPAPRRLLLVSDLLMPQMDGVTLARRARARMSTLPVVLMSGYAADALTELGDLPRGVVFVAKPPSAADLLRAIERAIEDAPS